MNEQLKIKNLIRDIPDFPKKGIIFRDITSLLVNKDGMHLLHEEIFKRIRKIFHPVSFNKIVAIESRGFILGTIVSSHSGIPLILARKPGKLPNDVLQKKYSLEYGDNAIAIQTCDIQKGDNVLVIDDLLATGGTANAVCDIVETLGGKVEACYFLIELDDLKGRQILENKGINVISSIHY